MSGSGPDVCVSSVCHGYYSNFLKLANILLLEPQPHVLFKSIRPLALIFHRKEK